MPSTITVDSWESFKQRLLGYFKLPPERRSQLVFRGQANATWSLQTSLDRSMMFADDAHRERVIRRLMGQFRRESLGLPESINILNDLEWELLGRHHGLPTPILDWTMSPFVASFFAFDDPECCKSSAVSVWVLDRGEAFVQADLPQIEIVDDDALIRFNVRAADQRAVFMRVGSIRRGIDEYLSRALTKFVFPSNERSRILAELDEMLINRRTLFRNLDGAAQCATRRVLSGEGIVHV